MYIFTYGLSFVKRTPLVSSRQANVYFPKQSKVFQAGMGAKVPLDVALNKAIEELRGISPYVVAARSGIDFSDGKFKLPFFNRNLLIHYPEVTIEEAGKSAPPPQWLQIIFLHYLLTADGIPVADSWITYRYLPGAYLFEARFYSLAIQSLIKAFGNDVEGFRRASLSLGGVPMSRTGDAAFRFQAFPQVPLACILYLGDEEVAPSISILFDASATHYLPTEDLSYLGTYLSFELPKYKLLPNP